MPHRRRKPPYIWPRAATADPAPTKVPEYAADLGSAERQAAIRNIVRNSSRFRAALQEVEDELDVARAWRSFPVPSVDADLGSIPAAFDVWVDHVRYRRTGDREARDRLFAEYRAVAGSLASRMYRGGEPLDDLAQVAFEALLLAIDRFDPDRRLPFVAFAKPTIEGSLKRNYRDQGWGMRVPRRIQELARPLTQATDELTQRNGRPPTRHELAERLGLAETDVAAAQRALAARNTDSLDVGPSGMARVGSSDKSDAGLARAENRIALGQAMERLDERDRDVLSMYFGGELSQTEIAGRYGVSQMQVSRWLRSALRRLGEQLIV
ncbi:MAG: sigma-70 family RNA polymerase sigma factor [Acidimicrobiales bacterium]